MAFVVALIFVVIYFIYKQITDTYTYWEKRGVKSSKPQFLIGNMKTLINKTGSMHLLTDRYYSEYPQERVVGLYLGLIPNLLIRDPQLIKKVLIKDASNFIDRGIKISNEVLSQNLLAEEGDKWRMLRQRLTPIFTIGKMKNMMPLLNNCVMEYMEYLNTVVDGPMPQEMKNHNMKYTLKAIGSVAFGLDAETFYDDDNEFIRLGKKIFETNAKKTKFVLLSFLSPNLVKALSKTIGTGVSELGDIFLNLVRTITREREGKPKVRNDFMDLMIEMKEKGTLTRNRDNNITELKMTDGIIASQAVIFYAAGYETSAGTMSFLFYELALNPEIQDRCYEEIKKVMDKYDGDLTYDALSELQYISMAFDETLRKYPIGSILVRQAVTDYEFEDINLKILKGTKVLIPVPALHNDPKYFPAPEKFDPERFSPENKSKIVDGTYLPFGDGPRMCIGMRFARVQSLLGVAHLLYRYRVETTERTTKKIRFDAGQPSLASADGIWLNLKRR